MRLFRLLTSVSVVLAMALVACGQGGDEEATDATAAENGAATSQSDDGEQAQVAMEDISFQPDEITVSVGSTVTWTNQDDFAHTVTSDDGEFDSGEITAGESFSFTFEETGTYPYRCEIHPDRMQGTITVEG